MIFFHHSLIIAICSRARHTYLGIPQLPECYFVPLNSYDIVDMTGDDVPIAGPSNTDIMTLDLHTSTMLIARDDLDITLRQLGLQHEAIDGVVDIYAVVRPVDGANSAADIGKDAVFRFEKSWVCRYRRTLTSSNYHLRVKSKLLIRMRAFSRRCGCSLRNSIRPVIR
jgi:hypothetical protein